MLILNNIRVDWSKDDIPSCSRCLPRRWTQNENTLKVKQIHTSHYGLRRATSPGDRFVSTESFDGARRRRGSPRPRPPRYWPWRGGRGRDEYPDIDKSE
ncbi:unnamed protein product [Leptosia nina]|uniref:Uncharacterized protein n=1 Tax=Leptosia nina TaxID=320188 RepID=A0AAV1K0Y3_9NEOP